MGKSWGNHGNRGKIIGKSDQISENHDKNHRESWKIRFNGLGGKSSPESLETTDFPIKIMGLLLQFFA